MVDFEKLTRQMGNLEEANTIAGIQAVLETCPERAPEALRALIDGMDIVGERFEDLEYFVGDLIFAGELFTEAMELLRPALNTAACAEAAGRGKIILATVEGDLHDIGKNIVKVFLEAKGFRVVDMGVNVSPAAIVQRAIQEDARIIALSAVLTSGMSAMKRTVEACAAAGIRDKVSIVIGGACASESVARMVKADFYGKMPEDTAGYCLSLCESGESPSSES